MLKSKKGLSLLLLSLLLISCAPSKQYSVQDYRCAMEFHDDFKVLQLTDLHFGIESDVTKQMNFVKSAIEENDPDLIILTGDNFMYSSKNIVNYLFTSINNICHTLTTSHPNRITKFAVTFGNHDNQGDYHYYYMNEVLSFFASEGNEIKDKKYASFIDYKDDNIYGLTNYFIDLVDMDDVKYRLHIIDSNTYYSKGIVYDYDVIHNDQLNHIENIYKNATNDKEYIGLAFFHIPFLEYLDAIEQYNTSTDKSLIGQGEFLDKEHCPYENNGSYISMKNSNIIGYFVGHDHRNYGDILYTDVEGDVSLLSYGVKGTDQLYHNDNMIGYKLINLKDDMTKEKFLSIENITNNIKNVTDRGDKYE